MHGAPSHAIPRVVIAGGGIAGVTVARELRAGGFDGEVTIIESEPACYDRPPLTKAAFVDGAGLDSLAFATAAEYAAQRIDVQTGVRVNAIEPGRAGGAGRVRLSDGRELDAEAIVVATGVRARPPAFPGGDLLAVGVLRDYRDVTRVRALAQPDSRIVVAGAGLIGAELTSGLVALGARVTLIDPHPTPGSAILGESLSAFLHAMHAAHGVDVRQAEMEAVTEGPDGIAVTLSDGSTVEARGVVLAAGIAVDTALAVSAGISDAEAGGAIVVDAAGRTAAAGVWAAGDATWRRDDTGTLMPSAGHWEAARLDGAAVAADILGKPVPTRGVDWFWSDRYGVHVEVVGRLVGAGAEIVRRGDDGRPAAVFRIADGRLAAAASVDDAMTVRAARRLIDQGLPVTEAELADPRVHLRDLFRRG